MAPSWGGVLGSALTEAAVGYTDALLQIPEERLKRRKGELELEELEARTGLTQARTEGERRKGQIPPTLKTPWGVYTVNKDTGQYELQFERPEQTRTPAKVAELQNIERWLSSDDPEERKLAEAYLERMQAPGVSAKAREVHAAAREALVEPRIDHLKKQEAHWQAMEDTARQRNSVMAGRYKEQKEKVSAQIKTSELMRDWLTSPDPQEQAIAYSWLERQAGGQLQIYSKMKHWLASDDPNERALAETWLNRQRKLAGESPVRRDQPGPGRSTTSERPRQGSERRPEETDVNPQLMQPYLAEYEGMPTAALETQIEQVTAADPQMRSPLTRARLSAALEILARRTRATDLRQQGPSGTTPWSTRQRAPGAPLRPPTLQEPTPPAQEPTVTEGIARGAIELYVEQYRTMPTLQIEQDMQNTLKADPKRKSAVTRAKLLAYARVLALRERPPEEAPAPEEAPEEAPQPAPAP